MRSACLYGSSLGLCWAQVVPMLGQVGPMLSHLGPILGLCWAKSGILGLGWPMLGICWAHVGPMLGAHVGPMLGLCWAYVGPMLSHLGSYVGAMFGPSMLRRSYDANFSALAPSWSPKPCKNRGFLTSPRWNPLPPKGPKHRKKTMFLNIASKIHRILGDFSWHGVGRGWTRGWVGGRGGEHL